MRRMACLLGLFLLTTGFGHGHHGHHGHHGSDTMGCGSSVAHHPSPDAIAISGEVRLDADGSGRAVLQVRHLASGAPVVGAVVAVEAQRLAELAPGTYVGSVERLQGGSAVHLAANGHALSGNVPGLPQRLALEGTAPAQQIAFDVQGDADTAVVTSHGQGEPASEPHPQPELHARDAFPVPAVQGLQSVEVELQHHLDGPEGTDQVVLAADAELALP